MQLINRGRRSGDSPQDPSVLENFDKFSSHNK